MASFLVDTFTQHTYIILQIVGRLRDCREAMSREMGLDNTWTLGYMSLKVEGEEVSPWQPLSSRGTARGQ